MDIIEGTDYILSFNREMMDRLEAAGAAKFIREYVAWKINQLFDLLQNGISPAQFRAGLNEIRDYVDNLLGDVGGDGFGYAYW